MSRHNRDRRQHGVDCIRRRYDDATATAFERCKAAGDISQSAIRAEIRIVLAERAAATAAERLAAHRNRYPTPPAYRTHVSDYPADAPKTGRVYLKPIVRGDKLSRQYRGRQEYLHRPGAQAYIHVRHAVMAVEARREARRLAV